MQVSEKLTSSLDFLKSNLASGWDFLTGASGDYTDLGLARRFGGASSAYSLRDIGAMNGRVVKVRRESDDGVDDFSAGAVASGGIESFAIGQDVLGLYNKGSYSNDINADYWIRNPSSDDELDLGSGACSWSCDFVFTGETFGANTMRLQGAYNGAPHFYISANNQIRWRNPDISQSNTTGIILDITLKKNTKYNVEWIRDASDVCTIKIDGVLQDTANTSSRNAGQIKVGRMGGFRFEGNVSNYNFNSGQHIYAGDGNEASNWLDTGSGTTKNFNKEGSPVLFTGQGISAFVDTWYDQSGNGKDATQSTTDDQPYIIQNGAIVKDTNLLPAIQWEWKSTTDGRHLDINGDTGVDVTSAISVVNTPSTASGSEDYRAFYGKQAENLQFLRQQQANRKFYLAKPSFTTGQFTGNSDLLDIASIVSYNRSGSTNTLKLSSTSARSVTVASDLDEAINFDRLGSRKDKADNHNGKWQEVIFYSRDLGDDEDTIIKELASNYKITLV